MLDEFIVEQKTVYRILTNAGLKNKYSHAYLFETKGYKDKEKLALAFAKYLFCPHKYPNNSKCVKCTQCEQIDNDSFMELKIIRPDGLWIKKEQLFELQKEFKKTSVTADKRIYIITDATKLNAYAANSILKFLEEPEENIIAILLADNIHQVLETIVSRCQIVPFNNIENSEDNFSLTEERLAELKDIVVRFINQIENKKIESLLYTKKLFHNNIIEKDEILVALDLIILYYKDMLNNKLGIENKVFFNIDLQILDNNTIDDITNKIEIAINTKNKVYINANTNLLIDKLIIELGGTYENSRNPI